MNQRRRFELWVRSRPRSIRALARTMKPSLVYRLRTTGQVVQLYSLCENGTVTVRVLSGLFPGHGVFGISPRDLQRLKPSELRAEGFSW